MRSIMDAIKDWLATTARGAPKWIGENSRWSGLGFDDVDKTLIVLALEKEFDVAIDPVDDLDWETLGELEKIVDRAIEQRRWTPTQTGPAV